MLECDNALIDKIDGQLRWGGRTVALDDERQVMTLRHDPGRREAPATW